MSRIDIFSCEPFRAWNRVEARPRDAEFDKVLQAGVHDALWMLTRQWQFGELQGEDTGSAIFSKIYMQTTPFTHMKTANGEAQPYDDSIPLEERIENMPYRLDFKSKLEAAYIFLRCIDHAAASLGLTATNSSKAYKAHLIQLYPINEIEPVKAGDDDATIINKVKSSNNENYVNMVNASTGRYFDGFALYQAIVADESAVINAISTGAADKSLVTNAVTDFVGWFVTNYDFGDVASTAWLPSHLEYQFDCALPSEDTTNIVLSADQYYSGDLDWFSFDVNKVDDIDGLSGNADANDMLRIKDQLLSVIPVEAKFAGSPNSRFWEFENGSVDLGDINAQTTDLSKLIFTEYALMYNIDWLLVPYRVPVGTLCEIKGIVVTDVFGQQFFIKSAIQGQSDNWAGWGMYNLSTINPQGARNLPTDTRLLVPPTVVKNLESDPHEEVHFVRDEMTNSIWAIEVQVPDELGGSIDGLTNARSFEKALDKLDTTPPADVTDVNAMFKYSLANTVPENWIPFIPVHIKDSNREIQLQRASMPRLFNNAFTHVRPNTKLLRDGIDDSDNQNAPYFINEEEVPRAGVKLTANFQRTRWYNGKVINWYGYRKEVGRGEGSSGLYYDRVNAVKK
ncbi:MAG: hypothetical protein ABI863_02865 [Ginsengibacter sp.]